MSEEAPDLTIEDLLSAEVTVVSDRTRLSADDLLNIRNLQTKAGDQRERRFDFSQE